MHRNGNEKSLGILVFLSFIVALSGWNYRNDEQISVYVSAELKKI